MPISVRVRRPNRRGGPAPRTRPSPRSPRSASEMTSCPIPAPAPRGAPRGRQGSRCLVRASWALLCSEPHPDTPASTSGPCHLGLISWVGTWLSGHDLLPPRCPAAPDRWPLGSPMSPPRPADAASQILLWEISEGELLGRRWGCGTHTDGTPLFKVGFRALLLSR